MLPVDVATYLYLCAISLLIIGFARELAWPHLGLVLISGVILRGVQVWSRGRSDRAGAVARLIYFVVGIPGFYMQLKTLIPGIHPTPLDGTLRDVDRWIFGTDPTRALQDWVHPVATEVLQLAYLTYYLLPLVLPVLLLWRGRVRETEKYALALMLTYFITYLGYIAVPANGPSATIPHEVELRGLLLAGPTHRMILEVDAHRFDCYPSGHTAVAVLVAAFAWVHRLRLAAAILTADTVLIVTATVYMRYHYVIDLPPGVIVAVASLGLAEWIYRGDPAARTTLLRSPS